MTEWVLGILVAAIVVAMIVALGTSGPGARARRARRQRYQLEDSASRIPLAANAAPAAAPQPLEELAPISRPYDGAPPAPFARAESPEPLGRGAAPLGRMVMTPDGEMILTQPPFALREAIFTRKAGRYVAAMYRRLPPWVVVCPRVRLDSLLSPTKPDGRDAADWRTWRHRVRMRSLDFVLCDRRTWKPLLAVIIEGAPGAANDPVQKPGSAPGGAPGEAMKIGGGKDRIVDEVLGAVGLPLIRGTGRFNEDWAMIRPYVETAILPSPSEADMADEARRARPNAAVSLLRMDDQKGWLLE